MHTRKTISAIALALLCAAALAQRKTPNPKYNGQIVLDQAAGGRDKPSLDQPRPNGFALTVAGGRPSIVWPGKVQHAIPTTASDLLQLLKALPGCSNPGWLLSPTDGVCHAPGAAK